MAKSKKDQKREMRNLTRDEKTARVKAAQENQKREMERRARSERMKKIFTVVVCVILILALGIPTMALTVLSSQ